VRELTSLIFLGVIAQDLESFANENDVLDSGVSLLRVATSVTDGPWANRSGGGCGDGDADVSPTMNNDLVTRTCVREPSSPVTEAAAASATRTCHLR